MAQTQPLPRSTPESQGIDSVGLLTLIDTLDQTIEHLHSLMIARHGTIVAEGWWAPYRPEKPHMLFSLSKSFTSSALGLAVAEGVLSLNDKVISFFPNDLPADVSDNLAAMEVRHLLMMGTGNHVDATLALREDPDGNWVRAFLAQPVEHEPGTYFVYNSAATYMCSAILQKLTGITLLEYLRPRLLDPLGIGEATWESCPRGVNVGGWGLKITTADIMRFGLLYAQRGVWKGQRILNEEWIDQATSTQISNSGNTEPDWRQGYGFQFWRCRHNAYRGDGAFGQYCIVLPDYDAVIAITSGVANMQAVLDVIWEHFLPALHAEPLPENPIAATRLRERLAALALPIPAGQATPARAAELPTCVYRLEANESGVSSVQLVPGERDTTLVLENTAGQQRIVCGYGRWEHGQAALTVGRPLGGLQRVPIVASGAWSTPDTFVADVYADETPFRIRFTCTLQGDTIAYHNQANVDFLPTEQPVVAGRCS